MPIFKKHFTLAEARNELPELRQRFARIRELLEMLQSKHMEMERIQKLVRSNGHGSGHPAVGKQIAEIQQHIAEITEKGIEIKDVERGLIDFPHWRDGQEVYLCWLVGEEDIAYWHTLEGGFSGRAAL